MDPTPGRSATDAYERLARGAVAFPAGPCQLGARFQDLPRTLRALDARERLGLATLLELTPPRRVELQAFSLAPRPVTNGEYLRFLEDPAYEDPRRWERVFEEMPPEPGPGSTRSFLAAHVRSILSEVAATLAPSGTFDPGTAGELAWVAAVAARLLGASLPPGHRADLAPLERERLALLERENAWHEAKEALDVVLGRLRLALRRGLEEEGPSRVDPRLEASLAEGDDLAGEPPVAALRLVARLREGAASELREHVGLRRVLYPLGWASPSGRPVEEGAPGAWPWAERPVTGVSVHEALAYAAWIERGSGERARVRLPTEAEHERAASFPVAGDATDARAKRLFPWEGRGADEPLASLARLRAVSDPFAGDTSAVSELLARTACVAGEERLEMLLGFHWEWTGERLAGAWVAARGGPSRLGGAPLTTRRAGFVGHRGEPRVGFRLVLEPRGERA